MDRFDLMCDKSISLEGDYSNDSDDNGGETKYGITKACAVRNGYTGAMKDLTIAQAKAIYKSEFYTTPKFDQIKNDAIAFELLDTAINCGPQTASRFLQNALNFLNIDNSLGSDLVPDGSIGSITLSRANAYPDSKRLLVMLNAVQCAYYLSITTSNTKDRKFINGWLNNRVFMQIKNIA